MATPKLTPAFNVFVKVAVPNGMGPGNEFSSLSVVNGTTRNSLFYLTKLTIG